MDPGTILAVVSLTIEVALGLRKVADGIGSSGRSIQTIATQLELFGKVLEAVGAD